MAIQLINIGTVADDGKGDTLRVAMQKINDNTSELYGLLGQDTAGAKGIDISGSTIATTETNADITLSPNGTGNIVLGAVTVSGTTLSSADSSSLNINENLVIDGDLNVTGTISGTFSASAIGDITAVGSTLSTPSNADLDLTPGGTGNVNLNGDTVRVGDNNTDATITTQGTGDLTLSTNSGTNSGTIKIADGANGDITLETDGTGDILLKTGGQVGIGTVSSPDTDLHIKAPNAVITLQRTADANTPGLSFQQSGGNVRGVIKLDGTSGTSNEIFMQTYDGSSLAERFRVTHTGAKVSGTLNVDDGISITDNTITSSASNADLEINASGTGTIVLENLKIGTSGSTVTTILDEDNMSSNSDTALATQQSIKAYVDSEISGVSAASIGDITFTGSTIISPSNADITLDPSGTGGVVAQGPVTFNAGYIEKINTLTSSSTITVDCSVASIHTVTLGTSTEFNITSLPTGGSVTLIITQDGSGNRTATFGTDSSTAVKFPSNSSTLSTGAADIDVVTIVNDGTNFLGNIAKDYRSS